MLLYLKESSNSNWRKVWDSKWDYPNQVSWCQG